MISIIIPCYNGAKFIGRLFACLGRQTSQDFEVILVDDGSCDDSSNIANIEASKYSFPCHIISVDNGGVSRARNIGLENAKGDYIMFVDVDDLVTDDRVEDIDSLFNITHADVVIMGSHTVLDKDITSESSIPLEKVIKEEICSYSKEEILNAFLKETVHTGVCGGAIRRSIIEENNLRFVEGLKYSEDLHFMWRVFACCNKVIVSNKISYHYMWVPGSAMSRFGEDRIRGYEEICKLDSFIQLHSPLFATKFKKFAGARILWSIVRQGAVYLTYNEWRKYLKNIDVKGAMRNLLTYKNVLVSLSSACYLFSPKLFYYLSRIQARLMLNTRSDVVFE